MELRRANISEMVALISRSFIGDDFEINGLGLCNRATQYASIVSYLTNISYAHYARENKAVNVLFTNTACYEELKNERFTFVVTDTPEEDFYALHTQLYRQTDFYDHYDFDSTIGEGCCIHPTAVIEHGVQIGNHVEIGANSVVRKGSKIGDNCHIGCLSVIGSEGFQVLRRKNGQPYPVIHVGGTTIGNNVWIGDQVTVCNAMLEGDLVVGDHCQIDNHCQIAHNCMLGQGNVLTAGVILLGSAQLKNNTWLAPGAMVMNRVVVEDGAMVGANSTANTTVKEGTTVIGTPAVELSEFAKIQYAIKKLVTKK